MVKLSNYRLHILPGGEKYVPGRVEDLATDIHYLDWDSLCRLHGEAKVVAYLKGLYGNDWIRARESLMSYKDVEGDKVDGVL